MSNIDLVAKCGLYCGQCPRYLKEQCVGCAENTKLSWCRIRKCCGEKNISTCAHCDEYQDVFKCGKFNNLVTRLMSFFFGNNRKANIEKIKAEGRQAYAAEREKAGNMSVPK